jgi:tRNA G18 (ribose-2'-O)-methylase SpoU
MILITDINDDRIKHFKDLKKIANDNTNNEYFVAEAEKVVLKLLKSKLNIFSMFISEEYFAKYQELINSKMNNSANVFIADKQLMSQIIGYKIHSGIMALAQEKAKVKLSELDNQIIVMNGIIDTENVGSIVRNSSAFNFKSIIYDNSTSSPYLRRAVRVSLGNIFNLKHYKSFDLVGDLLSLKKLGYTIISAEITTNSFPIYHFDFPEKFALIFGNEGNGVEPDVLNISDYIVHIPIIKSVDSINVAACSAVFMYDIQNSRSKLCLKI